VIPVILTLYFSDACILSVSEGKTALVRAGASLQAGSGLCLMLCG